ncbi:GNAT family N-acetyltransferase [Pollutibacter soli]|uniref:GNAT family N-acetyltransferase n=1 Tax=Pollutibacter soli TaxID=3034157 RepID=UPI003013BFCD
MSNMITKAVRDDLPVIYHLFEEAIRFQQLNNYKGWVSYDKAFIETDIEQGHLFKMITGNDIVCIFSVYYSDALIWREKESGDAAYLHRIVINRNFAGQQLFKKVLDNTIQLAKEKNLKYIRMDTWAENEKIISYYKSFGFSFVENYTTPETENLPEQHRNLHVALLEKTILQIG